MTEDVLWGFVAYVLAASANYALLGSVTYALITGILSMLFFYLIIILVEG